MCDNEILPRIERKPLSYDVYERELSRDCDLLLWEPTSFYGHMITAATQGPFSHISAVVHWEKRILQCGFEEQRSGVLTFLSEEVRRYPGKISVFRVDDLSNIDKVRAHLIDDLRGDYDWMNIRLFALGYFLGIRLLTRLKLFRRLVHKASCKTAGAFCSQHIASCFGLGAGVTFVRKETAEISPNDIGRAPNLTYLGTLEFARPLGPDLICQEGE